MKVKEAISTLKGYLREKNLKYTHQRQVVTEVFFDTDAQHLHPTIDELFLRVRAVDPKIGYATVYRTIKLFEDCKLASPRRFGDNQTRYESEVPGEHHDHMVCSDCGAIIEFEDEGIEDLQERVAKELGFKLDDHKMVLFGKPSADCQVSACLRLS
jgi:Fur family ferric uptake transcriptional regulator